MNGRGGAFDPQGPVAETIADLWWLMLALGVAVYAVVVVLLAIGLFRRRSSDPTPEGDEGRARRWLVWGGLVLPVVLITVVLVATVGAMRAVRNDVPSGALVVDVVGHQWWWEVRYPDDGVTTANELHIPVGRPVALRLRSADVIHSLWIPKLAGKLDVMPDGINTLVLQADEPGEHRSECAEFCGLQHAQMALTVVVEPAASFESWIGRQQRPAATPAGAAAQRGAEIVVEGECAECHTIRGTQADGTDAPDLTHVASRPTLGAGAVANTEDDLTAWVTDPHAIKEGVKMPAPDLTAEQLDDMLAYLETLE